MKKALIIRIVLLSALAVILAGVLVAALIMPDKFFTNGLNLFGINIGSGVSIDYENSESYLSGNAETDKAISSLDINWISGDVYIIPYDGSSTKIEEKCTEELIEEYVIRWKEEDGKLSIQPGISGKITPFKKGIPDKALYIYIPYSLAEKLLSISVDTTSADISIGRGIKASDINAFTTSGEIWLESVSAKIADLESVSGYINLTEVTADTLVTSNISGNTEIMGDIRKIKAESVSGAIFSDTAAAPESADFEAVSGKIIFVIPENDGFTLNCDSVSGSVDCEFGMENGKIYKNGKNQYNAETVSGNIKIAKK